jgi:hypothetical protein
MLKNGVKIITGTTPNPGRVLHRASVRLQQQLSGGMIGLIGLWIVASLAYRKKLPWDDPESRFLQIPLNPEIEIQRWGKPSMATITELLMWALVSSLHWSNAELGR